MNGQAFIANSKSNVDAWCRMGNPGWDWDTLHPYYQNSYTLSLPSEEKQRELGLDYIDAEVNAGKGPLQTSFPDALEDPVAHSWVETLKGLGYSMSGDPFSGTAVGGYTNAATIDPDSKTRSYSGSAYYLPASGRSNLHIITKALVEKILLDTSAAGDVTATGVQYTKDGNSYTIRARREVILSAGVFNSPKILELSGIGSRAHLEKHGIHVVVDNPNVGENLQDHVFSGIFYEVQDFVSTKDDFLRGNSAAIGAAMAEYQTQKSGTFTVGGNYSGALLPLPDFTYRDIGRLEPSSVLDLISNWPDPISPFSTELGIHVSSLLRDPNEATGGYFTFLAQADLKSSDAREIRTDTHLPGNYMTIAASLLTPLSRGSSHIKSVDYAVSPTIDPRYLSHPLDIELLARHVRFIETIAAAEPLASMFKPGGNRTPGLPGDLRQVPLEEVKEYVRLTSKSTYHPTSTCAMMPRDKGGVVDSRLRVWGTKRLRVVDASVIPIIPRANSQSTVYAVAERAGDLIKEDLAVE